MPAVDIVYLTFRADPAFGWFADGLARQLGPGDDLRVIVVDGRHGPPERAALFTHAVADRFAVTHVAPKPTPYAGAHRRTPHDLFCAANARNTGIAWSTAPYVVFADDCSVPMPGWLAAVRAAAADGYVVAGAYGKHWDMKVRDGELVSSRATPEGRDHRWDLGADDRVVPIRGAQLFGCSFGAPRELLIRLNGQDELCDPSGGEDYAFGLRVEHAGEPIFYDRALFTVESEELHRTNDVVLRLDREVDEARYLELLRGFGADARTTSGARDASHLVLDALLGTRAIRALGNAFDLARLRPDDLPGLADALPDRYWLDDTPLADLA